jgi:ABC-type transport system involved in cytochrome c biogenesis permease subunit
MSLVPSSYHWRSCRWSPPRRSAPDEASSLQPVFKTLWVHVTLSMLGTVGFAVAFVAGVMYLIQDGLLKSKRFNVLYAKLPALDYLDHLNQQSIVMGFPLLTLGIISGAFSAEIVPWHLCELEPGTDVGHGDLGASTLPSWSDV